MIVQSTSQTYYKQCELRCGVLTDVVWIPEQFAKVGKVVDCPSGRGFRVEKVYAARKPETEVLANENDHRCWRMATDI
jgi:hypothetical protein